MKHRLSTLILTAIVSLVWALPLSAESVSLNGTWTLDYWEQKRIPVVSPEGMQGVEYETIKAEVPGNVELDLLAAGLVENPEIGSNVYLLRPYEGCQWRYSRKFVSPERSDEDEVAIHFGGIDCYAEIYLNGRHIGSASNMLIDYEYDVTDAVAAPGEENLLEVYIRSSVIEGRRNVPPVISYNFAQLESVYSRRAPHPLVHRGRQREGEDRVGLP